MRIVRGGNNFDKIVSPAPPFKKLLWQGGFIFLFYSHAKRLQPIFAAKLKITVIIVGTGVLDGPKT